MDAGGVVDVYGVPWLDLIGFDTHDGGEHGAVDALVDVFRGQCSVVAVDGVRGMDMDDIKSGGGLVCSDPGFGLGECSHFRGNLGDECIRVGCLWWHGSPAFGGVGLGRWRDTKLNLYGNVDHQ